MAAYTTTRRILLIPMLAQGHMIPFMELAKLLDRRTSSRDITITIVTTPGNARRLRPNFSPPSTAEIAELKFNPTDHGLPPGYENTNDGPSRFIGTLLLAMPSLRPALDRLVEDLQRRDGRLPLCIVSDPLTIFSMETSRAFGILHAVFDLIGAFPLLVSDFVFSHVVPLLKENDQLPTDHVFTHPNFPGVSLDQTQIDNGTLNSIKDKLDPSSYSMRNLLLRARESDINLVNTVEELESKALDYLRSNMYKKLLVVGPLLASPSNFTTEQDSTIIRVVRWLDLHPPQSVVYVSFGSEQSLQPWQLMELARGLEESGKPFFWVLRVPGGHNGEFQSEWLPEGFEERVTSGVPSQGLLLKEWAPQVTVLSHESTGGFFTHCAWNSFVEGIFHGQPIVSWPMAHEQFANSIMALELGVGIELARKAEAKIEAEAVARALHLVMNKESQKGEEMRARARRLAKLMRAATVEDESCKGSSSAAIDEFIELVLKKST